MHKYVDNILEKKIALVSLAIIMVLTGITFGIGFGFQKGPQLLPLHPKRSFQLSTALFRNKGFLVNLKTERNASKFSMFMVKENPRSFFRFSFRATFIFPL